jgi:hypothetical protein
MTTEPTEVLLRESLQAHVDDVGRTAADPWLRVSRAHRRSRLRRRTAAAGALVAAVAVTGSLVGTPPWAGLSHSSQPADPAPSSDRDLGLRRLDDGTPRGPLGNDSTLRKAVVEALLKAGSGNPNAPQLAQPDTVHLLWGGTLEGKRVALARAVQVFDPQQNPQNDEVLVWLTGPADGGAMDLLSLDNVGPAIHALPYLDSGGERRLLAIVGRDATVTAARTVITPDAGKLYRSWSPVEVKDGVVDVPVPDSLGRGPVLLRAQYPSGADGYASSVNPFSPSTDSAAPNGLTVAARQALADQARGPGLTWQQTSTALDSAMIQLWSDAAHTDPRVEWAGTVPAARDGGSLVVASAGFPDQGRILSIQRSSKDQQDLWHYVAAVPAGTPSAAGSVWAERLTPTKTSDSDAVPSDQQIVVWMFGTDTTSVSVTVNGKARRSTTQDGLGWLLVKSDDEVIVTGHRSFGGNVKLPLNPRDVEPVTPDWPLLGRK